MSDVTLLFADCDVENEGDRQALITWLRMIARQVASIDPDALKRYEQWSQDAQSWQDAMMPLLDPTAYRDAMYNGQLDDRKFQADMLRLIVQLNDVCHQREMAMKPHRKVMRGRKD
jgi:hypothetical protein